MIEPWVIRKSGYFYRPNRCGYTQEVHAAGHYTRDEAEAEARVEPETMSAHPLSEFVPPEELPDLGLDIAVLQTIEVLTRSILDIETGERLFPGERADLSIETVDDVIALITKLNETRKSFYPKGRR